MQARTTVWKKVEGAKPDHKLDIPYKLIPYYKSTNTFQNINHPLLVSFYVLSYASS